MSSRFNQYCPVSMASDALGDRWTLLIVREMVGGATRFNEIERCLPKVSRSLLAQRLKHLERMGIIEATPAPSGRGNEYRLTPCGKELEPVLRAMGEWSVRWLFADPSPEEVDTTFLMWWLHRTIDLATVPEGRTVVRFDYVGDKREVFWLLLQPDGASICVKDPGLPVDVQITADPLQFQRVFAGRITLDEAIDAGSVTIEGQRRLTRQIPKWFTWSPFYIAMREKLAQTPA